MANNNEWKIFGKFTSHSESHLSFVFDWIKLLTDCYLHFTDCYLIKSIVKIIVFCKLF